MMLENEIIEKIPAEIFNELNIIGIPMHTKGYKYFAYAICLLLKNPKLGNSLTKCLYPEVAKAFNTTNMGVMRAMIYSIDTAFGRGKDDILYLYFGNSININTGKPTAGQFINTIYYHVKRKQSEASK